jgi:hypothetical protein
MATAPFYRPQIPPPSSNRVWVYTGSGAVFPSLQLFGLSGNPSVSLVEGSGDPTAILVPALVGSLYLDAATGNVWSKTGAADSGWSLLSQSPAGNVATNEIPFGIINGSNTNFFTAHIANPASSLQLFWNGLLMNGNFSQDYTVSGLEIQCAFTPQVGDSLQVCYRY